MRISIGIFLNVVFLMMVFHINNWLTGQGLEDTVVELEKEVAVLKARNTHLQTEIFDLKRRETYLSSRWASSEFYSSRNRKRLTRCRLENEQYASKYIELLKANPNQTTIDWYSAALTAAKSHTKQLIEKAMQYVLQRHPSRSHESVVKQNIIDVNLRYEPKMYPNIRFQRLQQPKPLPPGQNGKKIVGLTGVRNVGPQLPHFLLSLSKYTDAIVVLDDGSTDGTGDLVVQLSEKFNIEILINKTGLWTRDENLDHNLLIRAARELVNGSHFIMLDYDEAFSANCNKDGFLREKMLSLKAGHRLYLEWVLLWNNSRSWRPGFLNRAIITIMADNPTLKPLNLGHQNTSLQMHVPRLPDVGRVIDMSGSDCKLLEFRFLNLENCVLKEIWYYMIGRVHGNSASSYPGYGGKILGQHAVRGEPVNLDWYDEDLDKFAQSMDLVESWRAIEILKWFREYGFDFFQYLGDRISFLDWQAIESIVNRGETMKSLPRSESHPNAFSDLENHADEVGERDEGDLEFDEDEPGKGYA